ncbi:conserved hypothetical protein [Gammaproteobacteria bacterium]
MIYLILYLAVGVVLAVKYISNLLSQSPELKFKADRRSRMRPESDKLSDKIFTYFISPLLVAILILIAWPTVIYYKVKKMLLKMLLEYAYQQYKPKAFFVSRNDLLQQISVEEIELQERVSDPLNAVPDLPFGHLNKAWNRFLKKRRKGDEIWTFSANRTSERGWKELRAGYVLVRPKSVGPYFLMTRKNIELTEDDQ